MEKSLTAAEAFQLLVEVSGDLLESRDRYEHSGYVQEWMSNDEATGLALAYLVKQHYSPGISPKMMSAVLMRYCRHDITTSYINCYCHLVLQDGYTIPADELMNQPPNSLIDFQEFIVKGRVLGWKQHWNPFREPYANQWHRAFE